MADLTNYTVYENTQFEVLTDQGFKDFKGLIVGENNNKIILTVDDNTKLICTPKHKLILNNNHVIYAENIKLNNVLFNNKKITNIEFVTNDDPVYELLHVQDTHKYYVNSILSKQCLIVDEMAFIPEHIIQEFWNSVIPVISSYEGTKVFVVSTPNGTGNMFHTIYSGAERNDHKFSQWNHERIDWWELPGRGKKWERDMRSVLASKDKSFDQEFGCKFLETGHSAVDGNLIDKFRKLAREPLFTLEDGHYKIWEEPNPNNLYVIGVDVGEGIGQAASVAQILDISDLTNIKLVASYHNNIIDPYHFGELLFKIANQWGKPMLAIERNNCGGQVIDALKETYSYHNIIDHTPKTMAEGNNYYTRLGIYSHTNAKYQGVINMRYWVNSLQCVNVYDIALVQELESFVKYPNGTWKAKPGDYIYDDRVMSFIWGLFVLDTEIATKYYDVPAFDSRGKPLIVRSLSQIDSKYFKIDDMYKIPNGPKPTHLNDNFMAVDEFNDLVQNGWTVV